MKINHFSRNIWFSWIIHHKWKKKLHFMRQEIRKNLRAIYSLFMRWSIYPHNNYHACPFRIELFAVCLENIACRFERDWLLVKSLRRDSMRKVQFNRQLSIDDEWKKVDHHHPSIHWYNIKLLLCWLGWMNSNNKFVMILLE